ncbi:hypothetical protein Nepgr_016137 [Nepenthes gracilis]|uniref:DNA polymerase V n=1 Tax=Nepenthes gracilis TaxID=150966 RepID=A0AAD3XRZ4_NEPGR|nr:hypothetical protein Nepgr_016137 [Nepenthes gracilis]
MAPGKKMKKDIKSDSEIEGTSCVPSTPLLNSVKSMERKKKKKGLEKERHRIALENKERRKQEAFEGKRNENWVSVASSLPSSGLPEFHISVFNDLASANASVRQAAAETLVMELREVQKAYENVGNKEVVDGGLQLEAEKDDGLDNCAPSVRYAVRRLIRGVSSSRVCARQGFALGLTVLVGAIPNIRVDSLLKLIVDSLEVNSSMKGQEARDCLLGRLFSYGALARAGRLRQEWLSDKDTPYIKEFTSVLISLASKKRYLQEPAVSILLNLIEMLPNDAVVNHVLEAPGLKEWFEGANDAGNPDALLLALKMRQKITVDSMMFSKLLPYPFCTSKLFTVNHLSSLTNCLKESTFCQPRVHGLWPVLVNILLPDNISQDSNGSIRKHKKSRKSVPSDEDVATNLRCFCEVVFEVSLLSSSHDRRRLAFDVLLLMLPRLPASCVPIVVSCKFVQCLMDILSTKDSWLHKVAEHFLKELLDTVRDDDIRRVFIIVSLQKHSNGRFDCITRTKTVKDLMTGFTTECGCKLFIQELTNMFLDEGPGSDEPSDQSQTTDDNSELGSVDDKDSAGITANSDLLKSWVVESLPCILKNLKLDPEAKFRVQKEVMKFLAVQGLFSASLGTEVTSFELQEKFKWPKASISSALCRICIEQLQLLLSDAQKAGDGLENDLGYYFMRFLSTLCNIPSVSLVRALSYEDDKAFNNLRAMESRLSREERNCGPRTDVDKLHALRYLLIQLLLQVLLRPGEFSESASELIICCRKAFDVHDFLDSSGEDDAENGGPELIDVLVDTLLSLLPQSTAPMRYSIEQVFKYFCEDISDDGLLRMLRVIKKDLKPSRRKDVDGDDYDDDDLLGIEEADEFEEDEVGEPAESGDEKTDDSDAVVTVDAAGEQVPEASDDSDEGMDDDAMFRMDSYLARIFQERKSQAGGDNTHSQLVLFKLRVLSLLDIYLHKNPGKPQVLMIYSNLVQAFVNPHTTEGNEQLGERIWGILQKKILKAEVYPKGEAVQLSTLESLLEKSLRLASRPFKKKKSAANLSKKQSSSWNKFKKINTVAQESTYWILKIIDGRKFCVSELHGVFEIFQNALSAFFDSKKSQLKTNFVKEVFKRRPWVGLNLLRFLIEKISDAKSEFRRVEALELLLEILKSSTVLSESNPDESRKILKHHLGNISHLVKEMVMRMPEKQSRRAEVRKFCGKIFQMLSTHNLAKSFLKTLEADAQAACETHLGDQFLALKKAVDQ